LAKSRCSFVTCARPERVHEPAVVGEVGEDAQLYLRVVGVDQLAPRGRAEAAAHVEGVGHLLDVGVGRTHPPGRRADLVEVGVDAAGLFVDRFEQRLAELQGLLERAVVEDVADDRVPGGERFELPVARRVGYLLARGQHALQRPRELDVRVEVDVGADGAEEGLLRGLLGELVLEQLVQLVAPLLDLLELGAPAVLFEVDAGQLKRGERDDALELQLRRARQGVGAELFDELEAQGEHDGRVARGVF
jgi:hypothetical protein